MTTQSFDDWPEKYEAWFATPLGALILEYERALIREMLCPREGEDMLDAGCGTGLFTMDLLNAGARVTGMDISLPMVRFAARKTRGRPFMPLQADMLRLPFRDGVFDKTVSVTALEFIRAGREAAAELFRVTRPGGVIVIATLNRFSSWAVRRRADAEKGRSIFTDAVFRSPRELLALVPLGGGQARTCVHFERDETPERAARVERESSGALTGAFVAARWVKER